MTFFKGVLVLAVKNISDAKPKKKKFRKVHFLWIVLAVMGFMVLFGKISANYIKLGELNKEIEAMATMYRLEADKLKEILGERELEQMKKDLAVQKAVTLMAEAAVEVEAAAE